MATPEQPRGNFQSSVFNVSAAKRPTLPSDGIYISHPPPEFCARKNASAKPVSQTYRQTAARGAGLLYNLSDSRPCLFYARIGP